METFRQNYRGHGRIKANFNAGDIHERSVVVVTACELGEFDKPMVGDANVWVSNIAPHGPPSDPNNGVTYALHIDWHEDLVARVDITILDSPVVYEG